MVYGIFVLFFFVVANSHAMESDTLDDRSENSDLFEEQYTDFFNDDTYEPTGEQIDVDAQDYTTEIDQMPEAITESTEDTFVENIPLESSPELQSEDNVQAISQEDNTNAQEVTDQEQPLDLQENQEAASDVVIDGDVQRSPSSDVPSNEVQETAIEKVVEEIPNNSAANTTPENISLSTMPSAPEEQKEAIPEKEDVSHEEVDEIQGIDTLGLEEPRGNWLFKRIWWERAEGRYDKIRQTVDQINDVYIKFFAQRTELDKTVLDPFYLDIGFKQGELQALLADLIAGVEKERQEEGSLSPESQELLDSMKEEREFLQTLSRNAESILMLDQAADKVLERVMEQKSRVVRYEQEAWGAMREIARILSDKQARDLYYKMDGDWRNIKSIHQYLERDLQHYFMQLINDAKTQVQRIKEAVQALKEKGFDLKAKAQQDEEQPVVKEEEVEEIETTPKPKKPKGVFGYMRWGMQGVSNVVLWLPRKIWYGITSLLGWKR